MGRKWKRPFSPPAWPSAYINSLVYQNYYNRLKSIGMSVFEWKNLPPEIDERFLELTLFDQGMAIFYFDEVAEKYVALTTMIGGELDIYRIPKRRRAYAPNGYNYELDSSNSVLIFNNFEHTPCVEQAMIFAGRLYATERATDVNVNAQKYPIVILATEEQKLTMRNLYEQYDGNELFIFGQKGLDLDNITTINPGVPFVAGDLQFLKNQIWHEALNYFGIETESASKKERLVQAEAQNNMGAILAQRYVRLNARRQAAKQINAMFGLNIDVDYRSDLNPGFAGDTTGELVEGGEPVV